jgi:hypothetical protein
MTDEQDAVTYAQLLAIVRASGLAWVADQVEAEVAVGRLETVRISPIREEDSQETANIISDRIESKRGPRAAYLKALPYSSGSRLRLLIDAIEQAVVRSIEMQGNALTAFNEQLASPAILFAALERDSDIDVGEPASPEQLKSVASLEAVLRRLRELTSD